MNTQDKAYAERLVRLSGRFWKRFIPDPYSYHIRSLCPGFTLDIGCGIGRNLKFLHGKGVGIDHNPDSVAVARSRNLEVFTPDEFTKSQYFGKQVFDSILLSHVVEHMRAEEAVDLIGRYRPLLRPDGGLVLITPQEVGYRSDSTHVEFMDFEKLSSIGEASGFRKENAYSFPFPRVAGRFFIYNEFIYQGRFASLR